MLLFTSQQEAKITENRQFSRRNCVDIQANRGTFEFLLSEVTILCFFFFFDLRYKKVNDYFLVNSMVSTPV